MYTSIKRSIVEEDYIIQKNVSPNILLIHFFRFKHINQTRNIFNKS